MLSTCTLFLPLLISATTVVQDTAEKQGTSFTPLISIQNEGCKSFLVDDKDQRLLAALSMLGGRLEELPTEIPDFDAPPEFVPLLVRLLGGGASLTVGLNSEPIAGMPLLPLAGELRLAQASGADAQKMKEDIASFAQELGAPLKAPAAGKGWVIPIPVPMWMGSTDDDVYLRVGLEGGVQAPSMSHLLPDNAQMSFSGSFDLGEILQIVGEFAGEDPDLLKGMELLESFGMEDLRYDWAFGVDSERSHFVLNMPGWAKEATAYGLISETDLNPELVGTIPADATWAMASTINVSGLFEVYDGLLQETAGMDLTALIQENTKLDIQKDLIAPFGNGIAMYASDTTGGGGLLSTVGVVELNDRDAFLNTWTRLERTAAIVGREEMEGYMRFSRYEQDGLTYHVLTFPGVPIPVELSMTAVDRYAVFGVTPQAVEAAAKHIISNEGGLLRNPAFAEQITADDMTGVLSVTWLNTPRLMQDGYGLLSMGCSAVANMVRSPKGAGREPGSLLPTFNELSQGAKGMVTLSRRSGEDLRSETRADRSQLVNASGLMGYMANSPMVAFMGLGLAATAAMPRLYEAESQRYAGTPREPRATKSKKLKPIAIKEKISPEAQVQADIEALYSGIEHFAINNGGTYPTSMQQLSTPDENGYSYVDSAYLIDPWGDAYLFVPSADGKSQPTIELQE
ncbi:MAG: hypothetical protein ACI8X5_003869 [Planctomycetota bacterium]|jgi:hypothetical protein